MSLSQLLSAVSVSKSWGWLVSLSLSPLLSGAHRLAFVSLKPIFHQFERVYLGVAYSAISFSFHRFSSLIFAFLVVNDRFFSLPIPSSTVWWLFLGHKEMICLLHRDITRAQNSILEHEHDL